MLHRFRRAMVRAGRERLNGKVEVDETYVGIRDSSKLLYGVRPKSHTAKTLVAIAIETLGAEGVRSDQVATDTGGRRKVFAALCVWGCRTWRNGAYRRVGGLPIFVRAWVRSPSTRALGFGCDPAHVSMPGVHRVASLLKRWLLGTHQGAVQPTQLDYYLDEFTFRFNRRTSRSRGLLFYRLLEQAVVTQPVTYQRIAAFARVTTTYWGGGANWIAHSYIQHDG